MSRKSLYDGGQGQKANAGKTKEACNENRNSVDGKENPGEGRNCVENPQAKKAEAGMEQRLDEKTQGKEQGTEQKRGQKGGQQDDGNLFHKFPPVRRLHWGHTSCGQSEDRKQT